MPSYNPPLKNTAYVFYVSLVSQANGKIFQVAPTIAAGDFTASTDGAALANLATLPVVTPASSRRVKISLSASEMNGDNVSVMCNDVSGAEWADLHILLQPASTQWGSLATQASVDTLAGYVDTEVAAIKAKTDNLPSDPADASDIATLIATLSTLVGTIPSAATIATAVWASGTRTLTSFGTLIADIWANATRTLTSSAGGATAADVWGYVSRTLTQTSAQVQATMTGSDLAIVRAVTFGATLTGLNIPAGWDKLYWTVKLYPGVADATATVQIVVSNPAAPLTDGLLRLSSVAGTLADGSLVVDQGAGTLVITLADDATALLVTGAFSYDVKAIVDSTSVLVTAARLSVANTVTESIS